MLAEEFDAHMDPWCVVALISGQEILFCYATEHPVTGGMSWVSSLSIRQLDEDSGRAVTASGRRYLLGRRIKAGDIPKQGEEAWLAYDLLTSLNAADKEAVPPISADRTQDEIWVGACKIARHLGVSAPSRAPAEVRKFVSQHMQAYFLKR